MQSILESGQDAEAKKASSYPGNVPSPPAATSESDGATDSKQRGGPELRINVFGSTPPSVGSHEVMSEPLLSVPHGSSSSRQVDNLTSNATSPTHERRASQVSDTDHLRELVEVLADLEQQHAAFLIASSTSSFSRGNSLSPHAVPSSSLKDLDQRQEQFVQSARRFMELIHLPRLRGLLENALHPDPKPSNHEPVPEQDAFPEMRSPTLHPLLEEYYDAAGEVKLQGEALVDLDYQYAEDLSLRRLQEDQGLDAPISDDMFHDEYLRKRKLIELRLEQNIDKAQRLEAECLNAGLNLEEGLRRPDESDTDLSGIMVEPFEGELHSLSEPGLLFQPREVGSSDRLQSGGLTPAVRSSLRLADMKEHVSSWVENVETPGDDQTPPPFADYVHDMDIDNELKLSQPRTSNDSHDNASNIAPITLIDDKPVRSGSTVAAVGRAAPSQLSISFVPKRCLELTREDADEALLRLRSLDLASLRPSTQERWKTSSGHEPWVEDTKSTHSTTTPRKTLATVLGDTIAEVRAWITKSLSPSLPIPRSRS